MRPGLSVANKSQHLQQLRRAGLVMARRDGKYVLCRLADDAVVQLLSGLRRVAGRSLAEVDRLLSGYFRDRDSLEPVSSGELLSRIRDGSVTVLDVSPDDEFALGHLPGAVNIPLRDLERRLAELPPDPEVVAYCRGPYCVLSFEAVAELRHREYRVRRLEDGYPEWCAAGLPVEAVSAAEPLFASDFGLLVSIMSSGQIAALQPPPHFIPIEEAPRDAGIIPHSLPHIRDLWEQAGNRLPEPQSLYSM